MQINLAGYNLDSTVIEELKKSAPDRADVTPETLSAAYARISRDPRPIDELRKAARQEVEKARKSNQAIIFKMGHHSVAEHAVFNFDVIGVSRLAIEAIEHFRLCSFTEKSQRYITLGDDYVIPDEIKSSDFTKEFSAMVKVQNDFYQKAYEKLKEHVFKKHAGLAKDEKNFNLLDGWAKEDARYITSLATQGQLGLTINARNLELMVRRFASNPYSEVRQIGQEIYRLAKAVAPSIILFTAANDYDSRTYQDIKDIEGIKFGKNIKGIKDIKEAQLISFTENGDDILVSALLHSTSNLSFNDCRRSVKKMSTAKKKDIVKTACRHMEFYDANLREFEYPNLIYDIVMSASCFAQMKRHRTATITAQDYDPSLGVTIPQAIQEVKLEKEFREILCRTEDLYYEMEPKLGIFSQYILTNAHRRRILLGVNARELYHISRFREDEHAQWDIREVSSEMSKLAKKVMPLTMMLIGGKDKYPEIYKRVFGILPKITPPS
jgi:flavin-dependent thymidylate synthase